MSLDFSLVCKCCGHAVWDYNITHNLGQMAHLKANREAWNPSNYNPKNNDEEMKHL
jgi:hypothetical protein